MAEIELVEGIDKFTLVLLSEVRFDVVRLGLVRLG